MPGNLHEVFGISQWERPEQKSIEDGEKQQFRSSIFMSDSSP
jgi:hypothetical protein